MLKVGGLYKFTYYGQISLFKDDELVLYVKESDDNLHTFLTRRGMVNLKWTWANWWFDEVVL